MLLFAFQHLEINVIPYYMYKVNYFMEACELQMYVSTYFTPFCSMYLLQN